MRITKAISCGSALALFGAAAINANATLVDLGPGSFVALAPTITFDEVALGTINPSITLSAGSLGNVTVSFAGSFVGQSIVGGFPSTISGTPTGPLTLNGGNTVTVNDGAPGATSPVLSGSPTFNGPISVLFSTPVAAVGLKAGYFDAVGATTIQAFDSLGNVLGAIVNTVTGFEFYGLADSAGANVIAGISFYITGNEPAGFQIDNLTFGAADVIRDPLPGVPDGGSTSLMLIGAMGFLSLMRKRKQ